jgi:hypothetical protein
VSVFLGEVQPFIGPTQKPELPLPQALASTPIKMIEQDIKIEETRTKRRKVFVRS